MDFICLTRHNWNIFEKRRRFDYEISKICFIGGALTAFGLSVGLFDIGRYLTANSAPEVKQVEEVKTVTIDELRSSQTDLEPKIEEPAPVVESEETTKPEFYADGYYYIIGDAPKGFKDFDSLTIETTDYNLATPENDYKYINIPPKGYVFTTKEFNFKRISVSEKRISFETETIKGISYKFVGEFTEEEVELGEYTEYALIKGTLTKMRDGKKITAAEVKLAAGGC